MKQQLIHRVGRFHWNIIIEDPARHPGVSITIKSNCPEYRFYPVREFTSTTSPQNAASFLVWVRNQPIHQFINVVKYLLLGFQGGMGWDHRLETGKRYYEMASCGEKIEAEDIAAYKLFLHEAKEKEAYQNALRGKGQLEGHRR